MLPELDVNPRQYVSASPPRSLAIDALLRGVFRMPTPASLARPPRMSFDYRLRLPAITNPLALRDLLPDRWAKSHPEQSAAIPLRHTESAQAAQRRRLSRHRRIT